MGLPAQARRLPRRHTPAEPPPPPAPGFFEGVYANARASDAQALRNAQVYEAEQDAVSDIARRLIALGEDEKGLRNRFSESESLKDWTQGWNVDRVLAAAARRKAADPKAFGNLDTDAARWRAQIAAPIDQRYAGVLDTAARSTTAQRLVGGLWSGAAEPENVATMGIAAGGRTVAETVIRNMALQTRVEAVSVVPRAVEKTARGEDASSGTLLTESALAVVGSSVFEGIGKGIELGAPKAGDALASGRERAIAAIWDKLPESVRKRWGSAAKVPEEELPGLTELAIGRENMTPDERAAVDVLRREAEIEATNPFIADGAGVRAHREGVGEAMRRILSGMPEPLPAPAALPSGSPVPRLRGSTAISTTTVGVEGATVLKSRIKQVESSGSNTAKNPRSTALGPYQFIESTWRTMYKRRFGETGESDAAILAKRTDPRINELLIDDLISANARALTRAGHAADAGNLYLAHFAGPDGARRLLDADPQRSARDVLGGRAVTANPFLANMSAADVVQWAHRKMGGAHAQVSSTGQGWRERLQEQLDETEADLARLDAEGGEGDSIRDVLDAVDDEVAVPGDDIDLPVLDAPAVAPVRAIGGEMPSVDLMAIMPSVRAIARDRNRSLNQIDEIAAELGATPGDVRVALQQLVDGGELRRNRKTGTFMRPPREGPIDALKLIARRGGIHPSGMRDGGGEMALTPRHGHGLGGAYIEGGMRKGGRDMQRFIPGGGPLLRDTGMGLDEVGELLWSEGYFRERPAGEAEVVEFLEQAVQQGKKFYPIGEEPDLPQPFVDRDGWQPGELEHYSMGIDEAAEAAGIELSDAERMAIARIRKASIYEEGAEGPIDADMALIRLANEELDGARYDALVESDEIDYEAQYEALGRPFDREEGAGGEGGGGFAPDAGDAGTQRAGGAAGGSSDPASREALAEFDDPHGNGADEQIESVAHDVRATMIPEEPDMFGGATPADVRASLERQGEGRMKGKGEQKAPGSDGGLFDARAQDVEFGFRIDDEGDVVNPADLFAEFDAEDAAIKTIRDCLE